MSFHRQDPNLPPGVTADMIDALSASAAEQDAADDAIYRARKVREALVALHAAFAECEEAGDFCPVEGYDFSDFAQVSEFMSEDKIAEMAMEQARERAQDDADRAADEAYDRWRDDRERQ